MSLHIDHYCPTTSIPGPKKGYTVLMAGSDAYTDAEFRFREVLPVYTYRYRPEVADYYCLSLDETTIVSFVVLDQRGDPVALCPLALSRRGSETVAAYGGHGWLPAPLTHPGLSDKQRRAWERVVFDEAKRVLSEVGATMWLVEGEAMTLGSSLLEDAFPVRFQFMDASSVHHVVDLRRAEDDLWKDVRHSAQHEINLGNRHYEFLFHDADTFTDEIGETYRELHRLSAGRETRPVDSFRRMYDFVREGVATFVEQKVDGKTINITVIGYGKKTAYPMSTADDPAIVPPAPLRHVMLWNVCKECRRRGIEYFEVGETHVRDDIHHVWSDKEKNIAIFKKAFAGANTPLKRWICFASRDRELAYYEDNLARLRAHWQGGADQEAER